jgi:hypothetical protein
MLGSLRRFFAETVRNGVRNRLSLDKRFLTLFPSYLDADNNGGPLRTRRQ